VGCQAIWDSSFQQGAARSVGGTRLPLKDLQQQDFSTGHVVQDVSDGVRRVHVGSLHTYLMCHDPTSTPCKDKR